MEDDTVSKIIWPSSAEQAATYYVFTYLNNVTTFFLCKSAQVIHDNSPATAPPVQVIQAFDHRNYTVLCLSEIQNIIARGKRHQKRHQAELKIN